MKFFCRALCVALVLSVILSLVSCFGGKTKYTAYSFDYFDTATTIIGYEDSKAAFDARVSEIEMLLMEYHKLYDIYTVYEGVENLARINELEGGEHREVTVSEKIIDMLTYAKEMYTLTGGEVNIAMGSVLSLWHEKRSHGANHPEEAELPSEAELSLAAEHTDINNLIINKEKSTVYISDPKMKLDVGAIAKGYAVEMVARYLENSGVTGYILNVGGNVRAIGNKPDGENWIAGVENPDKSELAEPYAEYLSITNEAIVTSGSYQRYYIVNGVNYHHIIDKDTLYPSAYFSSVSVICESSAKADALSTALFSMSYEDGIRLIESIEGAEALWITGSGEKLSSGGFSSYVTIP